MKSNEPFLALTPYELQALKGGANPWLDEEGDGNG